MVVLHSSSGIVFLLLIVFYHHVVIAPARSAEICVCSSFTSRWVGRSILEESRMVDRAAGSGAREGAGRGGRDKQYMSTVGSRTAHQS